MAKTLYTGNTTVRTVGGSNGYKFEAEVIENNTNIVNNTSNITCNLYVTGLNGYYYSGHSNPYAYINIDGVRKQTTYVPSTSTSKKLICTWTGDISHGSDGTKAIRITFNYTNGGSSDSYMPSDAKITADPVTLTTIPRYATINSFTVAKRDETSLSFSFTANAVCDYAWYSTNNGLSWTGIDIADAVSGSFNVTGLNANTAYNCKLRVRRKDSQLNTDSNVVSQTTYDYPHVTSIGSNPLIITNQQILTLYNPLSRNVTVKMYQNNTSGTQLYSGTTNGTQLKFTPNANTLYTSIPNSSEGNCIYSVIYGNVTKTTGTAKYQIIGTEVPTFSAANWSYTADKTVLTDNNQVVINKQSTIAYTINTAASSNYCANITKYKLKWGDKFTDITGTTGNVIKGNGNILTIIAYDSRGLATETSKQLGNNYVDYTDIVLQEIEVPRTNGVEAGVKLNLSGKLFNGQFGSDGINNALYSAKYYVSADGNNWSSGYTIPISNFSVSNEKFTLSNYAIHANGSSGGFTIGQEYYVKVEIKDGQGQLSTDEIIGKIIDGKFAVDLYKDSSGDYHLGLNGLANSNYTQDIHGSLNVTNIYKNGTPLANVATSGSYNDLSNKPTLGASASKDVKTLSAKGDVGWSNQADGDANVISKAFMAYWNGRYNGSSSNLTYAHQGEIQCKPTVLYNNTTGTTGTVTLSETSANFSFLKIYYYKDESGAGGKVYHETTVFSPNGKLATLFSVHYANATNHQMVSKVVQISGTSITHKYGMLTNVTTSKTIGACEIQNAIHIIRVDGYK